PDHGYVSHSGLPTSRFFRFRPYDVPAALYIDVLPRPLFSLQRHRKPSCLRSQAFRPSRIAPHAGMTAVVIFLNVSATLAFGGVYVWGYSPLVGAAACVGLAGVIQHRHRALNLRALIGAALLVAGAIGLQLVPLPASIRGALSPHADDLLRQYDLAFRIGSS